MQHSVEVAVRTHYNLMTGPHNDEIIKRNFAQSQRLFLSREARKMGIGRTTEDGSPIFPSVRRLD
ncbi:hypothetical protein SAMN05216412_103315 [Nitrosospira multiformis]|uniref:Uncharacterized protein n=1 Tax=Nitrosospira multiformis TaxID=1231 RepID=A0A1I0C925_9PROT|nr:hypothetical protein SAMN05216412_103315 [Nitrosospira multiformis]